MTEILTTAGKRVGLLINLNVALLSRGVMGKVL
jgi:hypothetical protein